MARNLLLDESKNAQWPVGLPGFSDKVRLGRSLAAVLDAARPVSQGKGDQLVLGALKTALIERIIAGDFLAVYQIIGSLLDLEVPSREERKGLHTAGTRVATSGANGSTVGKPLPNRELR